jgi:hypothetical protein
MKLYIEFFDTLINFFYSYYNDGTCSISKILVINQLQIDITIIKKFSI